MGLGGYYQFPQLNKFKNTRCGDIDLFVIFHLINQLGYNPEQVGSEVRILVIPTNEELEIARQCFEMW